MKIRKLLSIGALGLAIAASTSIGAFAADRPSKEKIKTDMINMFLANKSPFEYNINKNTIVGSVINVERLQKTIEKYEVNKSDYTKLNTALGLIDGNKSVIENAKIIVNKFSQADLDELVLEVREVANTLRDIENGGVVNNYGKHDLEEDIKALVAEYNSGVNVLFGKNINGNISMAVIKGNQIILQLDSADAYKLNNFLNNNASSLGTYAQLLKTEVNGK